MVYDETFSSLSNSPTSVRTPDHDAFEVDLLDSPLRDFYNEQNVIMNSTQGTTMPIMAYSYNEQGMFLSDFGHLSISLLTNSKRHYAYCVSASIATL